MGQASEEQLMESEGTKIMPKTAKEMFEELGYKGYKYGSVLKYRKSVSITYTRIIEFDLERKIYFSTNSNLGNVGVGVDEHKSIHQQMVELGWLNE